MGKINVENKIDSKPEKRRKYKNQKNYKHKSSSKIWFMNGIHSLLSRG